MIFFGGFGGLKDPYPLFVDQLFFVKDPSLSKMMHYIVIGFKIQGRVSLRCRASLCISPCPRVE